MEGKRTLSAGVVFAIGTGIEQALAVLLLLPLYTEYLSLSLYGVLALLNAGVAILTASIAGPITNAVARFYYHPDYQQRRGELLFALLGLMLIKAFLVAVVLLLLAPWLAGLLAPQGATPPVAAVRVFVGVLVGTVIFQYFQMLTRWAQKAVYCVSVSVLRAVAGVALAWWLLGWMDDKLLAVGVGRACSIALALVVFLPTLAGRLRARIDLALLRQPLRYSYPMLLNSNAVLVMDSADRYLLKWLGQSGSVGLYDLGYQIGRALQLIAVVPIKMSVMPALFKKEADPDRQRYLTRNIATVYYALLTGPAIALSLLAEPIIRLLARDPAFYPAWQIVPFIAFTMVHLGLVNFLSLGIILKNRSTLLAGLIALCALLNVGLNILVIPSFDRLGAAVVTVVSYLLWNLLLGLYSRKLFGQHFQVGRILFFALLGWGLFGLAMLAPVPPGWAAWGVKLGVLVLYGLILWPMGIYRQLGQLIHGQGGSLASREPTE
jgi:O-antigen/teichoic acid export membrane protein